MNVILINTFSCLGAFVAMELVAWFTHKYIMHGFLWLLHSDHHKKDDYGFWERNDLFFLIFATPGIILILSGINKGLQYPYAWAGFGITLYGLTYFFIHDVFIHRRLPFLKKLDTVYFKAIRKAHKVHHKNTGKHYGECFGMLWVPNKYFAEAKKASR